MRLPSIHYLVGEARSAVARFPEVILAAAVAAGFGVMAIDGANEETFVRALVASQLGIPLFFALTAGAEAWRWPRVLRAALAITTVGLLVGYFLWLPERLRPGAVTRFLQFNVAAHLLVAFLPFALPGRHNGFWQYNKALFLRFLLSALYSVVVFAGLSVALLAIDKLLGLSVDDSFYGRLWVVVAFLFNTWLFVGGIPRDLAALDAVSDYPRALKVFAQYILIPLVVIYLTILTIYLVKVVVTTEWPSGWIGYMVSSVAVVGILALLLVWPVAGRNENRWVATYTRWFFIFMIPSIVMLLMAVAKRIGQYGVTENRYFLAVLAVWLAAVALYFIVSRGKRIKAIPMTLCAVAVLTSFGPWGAYTVARNSQTARLDALMATNGILQAGMIVATDDSVSVDDQQEISSITRYLVEHHGRDAFGRWVDREALAALSDSAAPDGSSYGHDMNLTRAIVASMGIEFVGDGWRNTTLDGNFSYSIDRRNQVLPLQRPDVMVRLNWRMDSRDLGRGGLYLAWNDSLGITLNDSAGVVLSAPMEPVYDAIERHPARDIRALPPDVMHTSAENDRARLSVYFETLNGRTEDGVRTVTYMTADCYVTFK